MQEMISTRWQEREICTAEKGKSKKPPIFSTVRHKHWEELDWKGSSMLLLTWCMVSLWEVIEETLSTKYPKKRDTNLCFNPALWPVSFGSILPSIASITEILNYYLGRAPRKDDTSEVHLLRKLPGISETLILHSQFESGRAGTSDCPTFQIHTPEGLSVVPGH